MDYVKRINSQSGSVSIVIAVIVAIVVLILIIFFAILPAINAGSVLRTPTSSENISFFVSQCKTYCTFANNYTIPDNYWCKYSTSINNKTYFCWDFLNNCTFISSNGSRRVANSSTCV